MTDIAIRAELTADEARELTNEIKASAERMYALLLRAHEGQAWNALGYDSWREYAMAEFGMSQSYAYRLLDQARVIRVIEAHSPIGELPNESQARELAKLPDPEQAAVWHETLERTNGKPTAAAVAEVSEEQRKRAAEQRDARVLLLNIVDLVAPASWTADDVQVWIKQMGAYDEELAELVKRAADAISVLDTVIEEAGR